MTIRETHEALKKGTLTVRALVDSHLSVAKKRNTELNAFIEFFGDIDEQIERAEKMLKDGTATLMTGIPLGVKDNMLIAGQVSTSGSHVLSGHRATYDATVIARLKASGAVIIGRTNMDEFAMGSSTESSYYGPTKHPLDPTRVPGGSSGGSAVAVASGGAMVSLGSDTGGSIRQPAALCGLVGMKPTYGAVSRHGLMAMASSLDQIGPFANTVDDAEILFQTIRGYDAMDSTSLPDERFVKSVPPKKLRIGVPEKFIAMDGIDEDVRENFRSAINRLKNDGHEIVPIELPFVAHSLPVYYIIMPAEVSSNLARYDGIRYGYSAKGENLLDVYRRSRGEGFGKEARRRVLLGTYVLSAGYYDAFYNKAVAVRGIIDRDFADAFKKVDVIAMPTSPSPAFKLGEKTEDPLQMYLADVFTVSANIAGIPAMSLPSGTVVRDGIALPVGLQLLAPKLGDDLLFHAGKVFESLSE